MERTIPDPMPSPETQEFWDRAAEGTFLVRFCTDCGRAHWYPRTKCPLCHSLNTEWRPGSGKGTIYSYSIMRRVPVPYVLAYVTLDEGPRMMTNIVDCDPETLEVGQPVRLVFRDSASGMKVPLFRPV